MSNRDIQTAMGYHDGTKHPDGHLMDPWHSYDPRDNPLLFKVYSELEPIPLDLDASPSAMAALDAISTSVEPSSTVQTPDFLSLSKILHFSAGITKRIDYSFGEMAFRAAACTGALFHIELYLVCGDLPGLEAGVYHFDAHGSALKLLRQGDYRGVLVDASGNQYAVVSAPAVICYTDVFWRNACKYQAREYRHSFWDSGTILSNTLAVSAANGLSARVVLGFVDETVNSLLGLDTSKEVSLAMVPLGHASESAAGSTPQVRTLSLETVPISDYETEFPAVGEMHKESSLLDPAEVMSWRESELTTKMKNPSGRLIQLEPYAEDDMSRDLIEPVIKRRGSTREFGRDSISLRQLSTILQRSTAGIPSDFLGDSEGTLNDIYLIVNAVEGLTAGNYVFNCDRQDLELLEEGDFRYQSGSLGLGQALPADASVNLYFMVDLQKTLGTYGNRGYRAAQLEASVMAGKIYLAAYAQRLGATGLTFYDDAVTQFFSPHAKDKSAMFLVAVGKRTRQ